MEPISNQKMVQNDSQNDPKCLKRVQKTLSSDRYRNATKFFGALRDARVHGVLQQIKAKRQEQVKEHENQKLYRDMAAGGVKALDAKKKLERLEQRNKRGAKAAAKARLVEIVDPSDDEQFKAFREVLKTDIDGAKTERDGENKRLLQLLRNAQAKRDFEAYQTAAEGAQRMQFAPLPLIDPETHVFRGATSTNKSELYKRLDFDESSLACKIRMLRSQ